MDPYQNGTGSGTNLLTILINIAFGFIAGAVYIYGVKGVVSCGTFIAQKVLGFFGSQSLPGYSMITSYLPYIVITPVVGLALRQLASVRSIRSFIYFAIAIGVGFFIAYHTKGYLISFI